MSEQASAELLDSLIAPPLDAYLTAKPNEPTWTLQGGDPLAPPLLRLWAHLARVRAGAVSGRFIRDWTEGVLEVASDHSIADNEREARNLLIRATQTEEVSWKMDDYMAGRIAAEIDQNPTAENLLEEADRLDLHDLRVRFAQRLNNSVAEIDDMIAAFSKYGFDEANILQRLGAARDVLKSASQTIEPRRLFQKRT